MLVDVENENKNENEETPGGRMKDSNQNFLSFKTETKGS